MERKGILVVDDVEVNRLILRSILDDLYDVTEAANGEEALAALSRMPHKPVIILLDVIMPVMDGFETMQLIKQNPDYSKIPVIFITAEKEEEGKGLSYGAVDYIFKPFETDIVRLRVGTQIELANYRDNLEDMVAQKAEELTNTKSIFLETMADLIEYRSSESGQHVKRTKELSRILALQLIADGVYSEEMNKIDLTAFAKAVPLHDIGKISIPDNILLKESNLTDEEFEIMKTHTTEGKRIIDALISGGLTDEYLFLCRDICLYHHEYWNGCGYPNKVSKTDIPLSARIVALVDVYDALVTERCYKKAFSHGEATEIIIESSGVHFDPLIVESYLKVQHLFENYEATAV